MNGSIYRIDGPVIQAKCRKRVGIYIMTRIAFALGCECAIEAQKNINNFMVNGFFTTLEPKSDNIPGINLDIDADGHNKKTN